MNYQFDSIVTRKEAEALKEMIFNRVRERSQAMTDDVQADVMTLARESFTKSNNNPFAKMLNNNEPAETASSTQVQNTSSAQKTEKNTQEVPDGLGFPSKEPTARAAAQNKEIKEQIISSQIQNNMISARSELSKRTSFMGALNFLNSQAAVSLMRTRSDKFEVLV